MKRYLIRTDTPQQFQQAKDLLEGKVRVSVTSERRLFLSAGDLPEALQDALRAAGARVREERPVYEPGLVGAPRETPAPLAATPDESRERALETIRALRRPIPPGWRFDRDDANER